MNIVEEASRIISELKASMDHKSNPIDETLPIIPEFIGKGTIKLIIIGQDPTIQNVASRRNISCTLNLDKSNSLTRYVERICREFGITLNNVYATNLFKYFYTVPPSGTPEVLQQHLKPNLELLKKELAPFNSVPVITLGEPVLRLLTGPAEKVRRFWDYNPETRETNGSFLFSLAKDNLLGRDFYPFPHQPSIRKKFYDNNFSGYSRIIKIQ